MNPRTPPPFVPLSSEARHSIGTDAAATHLGRAPATLRRWATSGDGPLIPIRVYGRLAWPVADLRRVLGL
jgi:hypothetical protein